MKSDVMSFWELVEKPSAREIQEMAKIQEKAVGVGSLNCSTMFVNVDGALTSLSTSKDGSQVVVAGRNVFKVIGVEESGFVEKTNLRVGRINLNFCITDVQWHPVDDHILATAAGNGAVILWNLNKITKQKQEMVFSDHKRTVNRIQFHPYEKDLLLSGSQDGTMKYFDLRKQNVASTFHGKSDIIRDVQFNPFDGQTFAAACENGNIQLWDSRQPNSPIIQYMGHNGPTFAVDWHPEEKNWVASAGRDTMVKIWDVHAKTSLVNTIQTISPVGRIKWRPQRKFQIASCSLIVDFDIHVWDIRRPYLPYASFSEHKDAVTGILWRQSLRNKDPYVFFSCAKDSRLYQHVFSDAQHPADHAPRVGLSVSVNGDISVAISDQLPKGFTTQSVIPTRPRSGQNSLLLQNKFQDMADNVREVKSTLAVHSSGKSTKEDWFGILARSYQLSGHSFADLCEYNCNVALKLLMHEHAQTWSVLQTLYSSMGGTGTTSTSYAMSTVNPASHASGTGNAEPAAIGVSPQNNIQGTMNVKSLSETGMAQNTVVEIQDVDDDLSSSNSERGNPKFMNFASRADNKVCDKEKGKIRRPIVGGKTPMVNEDGRDFPFSEDQDEVPFFYDDSIALGDAPRDWTLPSEAFEPRAALDDRQTIPSLDQEADRPESPTSNVESESLSAINVKSLIDSSIVEFQETNSSSNKSLSLPEWDFTSLVVEVLQHLADTGDVQMCVSALIVLGEKVRSRIDEQTQEQWIISYIDLLGRLQLWSVATQIIQLSSLPAISSLNQASTTVHTMCGRCSKPLTKSGWYCERCRSLVAPCSLCHLMVKGPNVWCQGCGHGGHLTHMKEWFSNHIWCPAGCGHMCEYT